MIAPPRPLRLLIVEDSEDDTLLLLREIRRGGFAPDWLRVETAEALREALRTGHWDLVIADYTLPGFSAPAALAILKEDEQDLPFLIVSGTVGEELAVQALKAGAHDVVSKESLGRLVPAIERELEDARNRRERLRAEEALRESERYHRSLIENASDLITIVGADGRTRYQSPALKRMLGYEPGELLGVDPFSYVHPDDLEAVRAEFRRGVEDPEHVALRRYRFRHRDGSWRHLESSGCNLLSDPAVRGVVINTRDLTHQAEAEEALRRSELQLQHAQRMEAIGRLAGGVAHDFNNLLTAIGGNAELVADELGPDHPCAPDLQEIRRAVSRAASLTRQLLAFSRHQVVQPRLVALSQVVAETEKMLRRLIGEHVELRADLEDGLPPVLADVGQLEQVLLNLAVNARDAMPGGGVLTLQTEGAHLETPQPTPFGDIPPGRYVRLTIADTGVGIAAEVLPFIFDPFFTTKEPGQGTGLGLSTVFGIVQQTGGHLTVRSEAGRGACFQIYLPARQGQAESLATPPPATRAGGTETVLVAEDDPVIRALIRKILEREGYRVLLAEGGPAALELAEAYPGPLHLVLTDVVMPGVSGRPLGERLRALRPETPIVFMSGYTDDEITQHGVRNRDVHFLEKPFTADALTRAIRAVLDDAPRTPGPRGAAVRS